MQDEEACQLLKALSLLGRSAVLPYYADVEACALNRGLDEAKWLAREIVNQLNHFSDRPQRNWPHSRPNGVEEEDCDSDSPDGIFNFYFHDRLDHSFDF